MINFKQNAIMPFNTGKVKYKIINFENIVIEFAIAVSPLSVRLSVIKSVSIDMPTILTNSER